MTQTRRTLLATAMTAAVLPLAAPRARAEDPEVIDARVRIARRRLMDEVSWAADVARDAKAMLIMADVIKGGLVIGGSYGEGVLLLNDPALGYEGPPAAYYSVTAASIGLQAGVQTSDQALFFMTDDALAKFRASNGWEAGVDAEVTMPDAGLNAAVTSRTAQSPVIAVVFGADGILIGASIEGAKYSPITP